MSTVNPEVTAHCDRFKRREYPPVLVSGVSTLVEIEEFHKDVGWVPTVDLMQNVTEECLTDNQLRMYIGGSMSSKQCLRVEEHMEECPDCSCLYELEATTQAL